MNRFDLRNEDEAPAEEAAPEEEAAEDGGEESEE